MVNEREIRFAWAKKQNGPLSSQSISRMECAAGEESARDAEGRTGAAFLNDVISYGGQTLVLAAFYIGHREGEAPFTGAIALCPLYSVLGIRTTSR